MASSSRRSKVRKPKAQSRSSLYIRDKKKKGPASYFDILRNKIARRRERVSLLGRANRVLGVRKFIRGAQEGRDKAARNRRRKRR